MEAEVKNEIIYIVINEQNLGVDDKRMKARLINLNNVKKLIRDYPTVKN